MKTYRAHKVERQTEAEVEASTDVVLVGRVVRSTDNPTVFRVGDGVTTCDALPVFGADV